MAIGTQHLANFEYGRSHFDNRSDGWHCITAHQARTKATVAKLITRNSRRMTKVLDVAQLADDLDATPIGAAGYDWTPEPMLDAWVDHAGHGSFGDLDEDGGAEPCYEDDDEGDLLDGFTTYADLLAACVAEVGGSVPTDAIYGTVLELGRNSDEYVANDGFIVTMNDWYRRGESRSAA